MMLPLSASLAHFNDSNIVRLPVTAGLAGTGVRAVASTSLAAAHPISAPRCSFIPLRRGCTMLAGRGLTPYPWPVGHCLLPARVSRYFVCAPTPHSGNRTLYLRCLFHFPNHFLDSL